MTMAYIGTKWNENIWESKITYQESVLTYFENFRYLKTG